MTAILGISGSLRKGSFNTSLLRAAGALTPEGAVLTPRTLHGIPLYDADVEAAGFPAEVAALKDAIAAADGVILFTPEYNNSLPGVFKNAIDWCSRPPADVPRVFRGRPFAVLGASPGGFGTILSQDAWLPVLHTLGVRQWHGARLMVSRAGGVFDGEGTLTDEQIQGQLKGFLDGFTAFVRGER